LCKNPLHMNSPPCTLIRPQGGLLVQSPRHRFTPEPCQLGYPLSTGLATPLFPGFRVATGCDKWIIPYLTPFQTGPRIHLSTKGRASTMTVACYVRVSSRRQKDDSQRAEIQKWLDANGINPAHVAWYADKETGKTLQRPAFEQLQAD